MVKKVDYDAQRKLLFESVHWLRRSKHMMEQCLEFDDEGLIELVLDDVDEFLARAEQEGIA